MDNELITSKKIIYPGDMIGVIGESCNSLKLVNTAKSMGFKVSVYVTSESNEVIKAADKAYVGSLHDGNKLQRFSEHCKIVMYESDLVDIQTIQYLQQFVSIPQGVDILELSQDRIIEKATIEQLGLKVSPYVTIVDLDDLYESIGQIGYPAILRPILKDSFHDQALVLKNEMDLPKAGSLLERGTYLLQSLIDDGQEIEVTVVKDKNNKQKMFPMIENKYDNFELKETQTPVNIDSRIQNQILEYATKVANYINYIGVFSLSFKVKDGYIYFKSLIPGIHDNQNIYELATNTSVYEEMLRAVSGMTVSDIRLQDASVMLNISDVKMNKIKTQWLIKDNWHFYFYPQAFESDQDHSHGYILIDGDSVKQIQEQIDNTDIW